MVIEEFSSKLLSSKMINTYVATAFFAVVIFFTLNADIYTPFEMLFGVIFTTIAFKGLSYMMSALVISLYDLNNQKESIEFGEVSSRINGLLNDLSLQQTKMKSHQVMQEN